MIAIRTTVIGLLSLLFSSTLLANPTGGSVAAGNATISNSGNTTTIDQTSDRAVIDWSSFNINSGEITDFIQPSASSVALNRINGNTPSSILGTLNANGQVFLINPAGFIFGKSATVNVGSLVATTANMTTSPQDFVNGASQLQFSQPNGYNNGIVNHGTITAANTGLVALVAPGVENDGAITANLGKVTLASGNDYTVDLGGDHLIQFDTGIPVSSAPMNPETGSTMTDAVANHGTLKANGGTVTLEAHTAADVVANDVNMDGVVEAESVKNENGTIVLSGDNNNIQVNGTVDASGQDSGTTGGTVNITAPHVALLAKANINASGPAGGGTINVGGELHGGGTLPHAQTVYVDPAATLNASATDNGNGGTIAVWSDQDTAAYGTFTAEGGPNGGNGGIVETSGHYLDITDAQVDTSAPLGQTGTWLLDPGSITITSTSSPTQNCAVVGSTLQCVNSSQTDTTLSASQIATQLSNNNVLIQTDSGDINVNADIVTSATNKTLTLTSANNINVTGGNINLLDSGTIVLNAANGTISIINHTLNGPSRIQLTSKSIVLDNATIEGDLTNSISATNAITIGQNGLTLDINNINFNTPTLNLNGFVNLPSSPISLFGNITNAVNVGLAGSIQQALRLFPSNTNPLNVNSNLIDTQQTVSITAFQTLNLNAIGPGTVTLKSFTFNSSKPNPVLTLSGNWATVGGSFTFNNPVNLKGNTSLTSDTGITFASTINNAFGLTLAAPTLTLNGAVGSITPLSSFNLGNVQTLNLNNIINANSIQGVASTVNVKLPGSFAQGIAFTQFNGNLTVGAGDYSNEGPIVVNNLSNLTLTGNTTVAGLTLTGTQLNWTALTTLTATTDPLVFNNVRTNTATPPSTNLTLSAPAITLQNSTLTLSNADLALIASTDDINLQNSTLNSLDSDGAEANINLASTQGNITVNNSNIQLAAGAYNAVDGIITLSASNGNINVTGPTAHIYAASYEDDPVQLTAQNITVEKNNLSGITGIETAAKNSNGQIVLTATHNVTFDQGRLCANSNNTCSVEINTPTLTIASGGLQYNKNPSSLELNADTLDLNGLIFGQALGVPLSLQASIPNVNVTAPGNINQGLSLVAHDGNLTINAGDYTAQAGVLLSTNTLHVFLKGDIDVSSLLATTPISLADDTVLTATASPLLPLPVLTLNGVDGEGHSLTLATPKTNGQIALGGNFNMAGGNFTANNYTVLLGTVAINTTGDIDFAGNITGPGSNLNLQGNTITLQQVGDAASNALASFTQQANTLNLYGPVYARNVSGTATTVNAFSNQIPIQTSLLGSNSISSLSLVAQDGTGTLNIAPGTYNENINFALSNNAHLNLGVLASSDVSDTVTINSLTNITPLGLEGNWTTLAGNFNFNAPLDLFGPTTLTTSGSNSINFNSTIDGPGNLTLNSSQPITITQPLGATTRLGNFTANGTVTANSATIYADNINISKLVANNAFLSGLKGLFANVVVNTLTLDGLNGGIVEGIVDGFDKVGAALVTRLASTARGSFFVNGCLLPGAKECVNIEAINIEEEHIKAADKTLMCTLEAAAGDKNGAADCENLIRMKEEDLIAL